MPLMCFRRRGSYKNAAYFFSTYYRRTLLISKPIICITDTIDIIIDILAQRHYHRVESQTPAAWTPF